MTDLAVIASAAVVSELPVLERELAARGAQFSVSLAAEEGDATRLTREALGRGERFLVAAGGDSTVHEVVNGLIRDEEPVPQYLDLGVVAANSGCDFVKTFGLPGDTEGACRHLFTGNYYDLDLVKLTCAGPNGQERVRYFANLAQAGLGAAVTVRTKRLPRFLGRARKFLGFWLTIPVFRTRDVSVTIGRKSYDGPANNVVVANCQFAGGGLRLSPRSYPGDGVLDVLVMKGPKSDAFTTLPSMWRGEHVPSDHIAEMSGKEIRIDASRPMVLEADGELVGFTPATFEVIPRAIRLRV